MVTRRMQAPFQLDQLGWGAHTIEVPGAVPVTGRIVDVTDGGRTIVLYVGHLVGESGHLFNWAPESLEIELL